MFLLALAANCFGSGSGLNVVVVVNQASTNSVELGNYYCEKRGVPPQNVLRINWTGGNVIWTQAELNSLLRAPLNAMLASRQLSNQIDFVMLSMDIPYKVTNTLATVQKDFNSTTATLFYGFKPNPLDPFVFCSLAGGSASAYGGSEAIFRQTPPISTSSNSWLVAMITASNLPLAKAVVDRGVSSDYTAPTQSVYFIKTDDTARNVRYWLFDNSQFDNRVREAVSVVQVKTNSAQPPGVPGNQLGAQMGADYFGLSSGLLVPGAMADTLTSFGGQIFEDHHTGVMEYIGAGATASYGTVVEPCNYFEKFPSPQNYFYQARGFSIAECYYQSVTNPYMGLLVGEPLCAPFAVPATGGWSNLPANALLAGTTNLSLQFNAPDRTRPVQQVDLFLDGTFLLTVTNLLPRQNNQLFVTLNGQTTNLTVPANATLKSVASNLTAVLRTPAYSNATKVAAISHGDRIELQGVQQGVAASAISVSVSNAIGGAAALTTHLVSSRSNFVESVAKGVRSFAIGTGVVTNDVLTLNLTKTNGALVTVSITNTVDGTTLPTFIQMFMNAINGTAALQGADGVVAEDLVQVALDYWQINLTARSPGWNAAQIQVVISGDFAVFPSGNNRLDEKIEDLRPRNHLYVLAGLTNLPVSFGFNTTTQADGFHELTAVAYEGSHVRTQKRISQNVRIQNTILSATLTSLMGDTNTALEATLQFLVVANTNTISKIEFFTTGGLLATSNSVSSAVFSVAATNLGIGLHPFYAIVTRNDNKQYRTETKWIRIIGAESPFTLTVSGSAPTLTWSATAGRRYEILSSVNVTSTYTLRDATTPTNSLGIWSETNNSAPQRFYRARVVP